MTEFIFVYVTCPSIESAQKIATKLVTEKLAACANILPSMTAIYRWNGKIENDQEVVLILKSKKKLFSSIEEKIRALHEAKTPCIVAIPIANGSAAYLNWLNSETNG